MPPPVGAMHRLEADYYRRMRPQRVYALRLRVEKAPSMTGVEPPPPAGALVFRPVIAGALVTPAEAAVPLHSPKTEVVFHVTPMAFGELPETRVEYSLPGQPVHALVLPMRGVGHAWAARWLFLFLVVPVLLFALRGAKSWATQENATVGTSDRVKVMVPEWAPGRDVLASAAQDFVDFLVLHNGAVRLSFLAIVAFGGLTVWSFLRNRVSRATKSSEGFSLFPSGNVGSDPRTLPSFLESVDPKK